ncbi:MAG: hypothetical protein ACR2OZ_01710 [Verrucomicrobiales bacterium]
MKMPCSQLAGNLSGESELTTSLQIERFLFLIVKHGKLSDFSVHLCEMGKFGKQILRFLSSAVGFGQIRNTTQRVAGLNKLTANLAWAVKLTANLAAVVERDGSL